MQIIHHSQRPWHLQTRWMTWDGDQNFEPKNGQFKFQTINWRCSVGKQTCYIWTKNNEIISKIFHMQQNQCVSTVSSSGLRIAIRAHNAAPKLPRIEIFCTMPRWKQRFFTCPRYESSGMRWLGLRPGLVHGRIQHWQSQFWAKLSNGMVFCHDIDCIIQKKCQHNKCAIPQTIYVIIHLHSNQQMFPHGRLKQWNGASDWQLFW